MSQRSNFKIIPEENEIASIERDLRFHPCENENPETLSRIQIDEFNRDGFLSPIQIFDKAEANDNRRYFDRLLEKVMAEGGDSYSISTAHKQYGRVYDLLTHPRIVNRVSDLLGENLIGWGTHYFCKMPGDGKSVSWHQDASYWPLTPSNTVTVWLAVDDSDVENGCMQVIAGTHLHGHIPYSTSEKDEDNVLDQTVDNAERFGQAIDIELKAGEISIHGDLLLHASNANESNRRRCGLTLRYCSADVRAHLDWNNKGVFVRGSDPTGHWANSPRPQHD